MTLTADHFLDTRWDQVFWKLDDNINRRFQPEYKKIMKRRAKGLQDRIQNTKRSRQRRGLFNFIGDIGSTLFGIPSASDISSLKKANQRLATEVQGVVTVQRKVIAKVNLLGQKQQEMLGSINSLIETTNQQWEQINLVYTALKGIQTMMEQNQDATRIILLFELIADSIAEYEDALAQIQAVRIACEAGIVNEHLLPISFVKNILASGENRYQMDPLKYYSYIQVRNIVTIDDNHYCILRAPLLSDATQAKIQVHTFPVCNGDSCAQLYQPPPFIINYETEDVYFPDECYGPIPQVCQPGVVFDKVHQPCLHGLINGDTYQQAYCPITRYNQKPPPGPILTAAINRYILGTSETLYHYRCPQRTPMVDKLVEGNYIIDVEPRCILDAGGWMLRGLPTIHSNYSAENFLPKPINITWFHFTARSNLTLDLEPPREIRPIAVPHYENIELPANANIKSDIDKIQAEIGKHPVAWWVWLLIAIGGTLTLIFTTYYMRKTICPTGCPTCYTKSKVPEPTVHYNAQSEQITVEQQTCEVTADDQE